MDDILKKVISKYNGKPFEFAIESFYGVAAEKFDCGGKKNRETLGLLAGAAESVCKEALIRRSRPNEVGNDIEGYVIPELNNRGLNAARPKTKSGKGKSTGYPDIRIQTEGSPIYLEIKTYSAKNRATTLRSFYFSPADNPKVFEDGFHLAMGFEIERDNNLYKPVAFEIVDLFGLTCYLKLEYNSNNRLLYEDCRVIARGRV